jgi:hypothetical protein
MTKQPKPDQVCIGLSIEGDLLRLATVGREGRNIRVLDLACMTLPTLQTVPAAADPGDAALEAQIRSTASIPTRRQTDPISAVCVNSSTGTTCRVPRSRSAWANRTSVPF